MDGTIVEQPIFISFNKNFEEKKDTSLQSLLPTNTEYDPYNCYQNNYDDDYTQFMSDYYDW